MIDYWDFAEVEFVEGNPPIILGWRMDWDAYHAACDALEAELRCSDKSLDTQSPVAIRPINIFRRPR